MAIAFPFSRICARGFGRVHWVPRCGKSEIPGNRRIDAPRELQPTYVTAKIRPHYPIVQHFA